MNRDILNSAAHTVMNNILVFDSSISVISFIVLCPQLLKKVNILNGTCEFDDLSRRARWIHASMDRAAIRCNVLTHLFLLPTRKQLNKHFLFAIGIRETTNQT